MKPTRKQLVSIYTAKNKSTPLFPPTADSDDRMVPMHSFKFFAELQHRQAGLLRVETGAGHGACRPLSKEIDEATDRCAFLIKNLGVTVPGLP